MADEKSRGGVEPVEGAGQHPDCWAEAFTTLLSHTNISYEEICDRTIPQIEAILTRLDRHISLRTGVPFYGSSTETGAGDDKPPKLHELSSFCDAFSVMSR